MVAVCPNDETLRILKVGTWEEVSRLTNHDKLITGVDWSAQTNKIVTSSQDRNAFVWDCVDGDVTRWEPTLVLLRLTRSATCVRWSPKGDKFAVGSGEKSVCICQFMEEFGAGGGWTSKSIRKCPLSGKSIKSTVLSIAWHPNNCFIAVGSADMKCRVFNAYLKQVDGRNPAKGAYGLNPAEKKFKFGSCIAEYGQAKGWVHDAVFNPSGTGARARISAAPAAPRKCAAGLSGLCAWRRSGVHGARLVAAPGGGADGAGRRVRLQRRDPAHPYAPPLLAFRARCSRPRGGLFSDRDRAVCAQRRRMGRCRRSSSRACR